MTSVTCAMIDDFMTFVLRTCRALDVILWHIFHFRCDLWIFTYVAWSIIDDFMSPDFWPVIRSMPILGHISVLIEIYGSSWSCMLIPTYEIHIDTMFPPWSLSGVTQLGLHFATLRCHHAFLPGDAPLIYGSDSVVHVDDLDRAFDDGWSELIWFFWPITHCVW